MAENATQRAQKFDEKTADVLELEDSLSEKVSALLLPHLTGEEPEKLCGRGTGNARATEKAKAVLRESLAFAEKEFAKPYFIAIACAARRRN